MSASAKANTYGQPKAPKRGLAKALVALGATVLVLAQVGLFLKVEPFPTWFYVFAWWSWILIADGVVHLRSGSSLLISRTRSFLLLLPWSLAFWLFFESANFILQDWYYVAVPADPLERLIGISISFATVLPGVMETVDLLAVLGLAKNKQRRAFRFGSKGLNLVFLTGLCFLVLPLLFSDYAYPLIWGATVLLVEPLLFRAGKRCYLSQFARGDYSTAVRYLVAGLCCGVLWEFWNYWATAKWIYTVPFFEEGKLFEMPVLGFLGYPPFALEIYSFARLLVALRLCPEFERAEEPDLEARSKPLSTELQILGLSSALLFSSLVLPKLNRETVKSTAPTMAELLRDPEQLQRVRSAGYRSFDQLTVDLRNGVFAKHSDLTAHEIEALLSESELMRLAGMGRRGVAWLETIAIYTVDDLAEVSEQELVDAVLQFGSGPAPMPYAREIRVWHRRAKAQP